MDEIWSLDDVELQVQSVTEDGAGARAVMLDLNDGDLARVFLTPETALRLAARLTQSAGQEGA